MTKRTTLEAGCCVRSQIRRILRKVEFTYSDKLDVTTNEERGWVDSVFYLTIEGEAQDIRSFLRRINTDIKEYHR